MGDSSLGKRPPLFLRSLTWDYVAHVNEIVANTIFHRRLHHFFHERSEVGVAELHGDETIIPLE